MRGEWTGKQIRAWRDRMGLKTRKEAAEALRMPVDTLSQYERDLRPLPGVAVVAMVSLESLGHLCKKNSLK